MKSNWEPPKGWLRLKDVAELLPIQLCTLRDVVRAAIKEGRPGYKRWGPSNKHPILISSAEAKRLVKLYEPRSAS